MQALKPALSMLANQLERQGFIGMKRQGSLLNSNLSLKPLVDFVSWMNQTTEAQQLLQELGIEWKQPVLPCTTLEVCAPVRIISTENNVTEFNEKNYVGLCGTIAEIDFGDNGAQDMDPLYIVLLEDGRSEGFWADELEICEPALV